MTEVKVVLGFIELALAVKFLANADNVEQWGILKREIFVGAWVLISAAIVLYLAGWLKIGHTSGKRKFSALRIGFILFFSAFTLYLTPGLTNTKWADLRLLSGFPRLYLTASIAIMYYLLIWHNQFITIMRKHWQWQRQRINRC